MINSKQRAYLKGLANKLNPSLQIGKEGLTENILKELDIQLEQKELIKISVLENSPVLVDEVVEDILSSTQAEFVQKIGSKLVIYRESKENKKIQL
ncbi:ribosome assembly RNA-binding protein YhbY [Neofamilia massiliensis]|uniref:ribosome assembly RNA-binding protein YhbY n=1 Tax=Neofamilia massiliensis TaxID=1673724 RepID=UPI0006BB702E|nr:ribosome assembly RNA-binding protein YhbY [Neofamilia massiliensis]